MSSEYKAIVSVAPPAARPRIPAWERIKQANGLMALTITTGLSIIQVSPQLDPTVELNFPASRRFRNTSNNSTVQSRTGDVSQSRLRAPGRKQSVCKCPSLSFTSQETATIIQTQSFCARRPKPNLIPSAPVPRSPVLDLSSSKALSPLDIQTPERSPTQSRLHPSGIAGIQTPVSKGWAEPCDTPDTSLVDGPGQVLAEDTPEHEYGGVRITWRRRQELMKYLKSRGKLKSIEVLVRP
ncbi:RAD9, HUS1, RAD1-interacting nuclear orphan protein 1-like [Mixophyes fleayi]|uniref:RAD9, HUS1, RAD1-interacting nuclear orphan protein 1-like n=1 Tax=Mixophyes fleayi TaxID=3061075 RepID=UPI003F4D766B